MRKERLKESLSPREVSCLALTFFYDYLKARRISRRSIQADLPFTPDHLDETLNWIDFHTFVEIEERMRALFPHVPNLFFDIGKTFAETRGFAFVRILARAVASPLQAYMRIPGLVKRYLFPFLDIHFERRSRSVLVASYSFTEGFVPTEAFLDTVRGILAGVPRMVGAPNADVSMHKVHEHSYLFTINLKSEWHGIFDWFKQTLSRFVGILRLRVRNMADAARELEETNSLLKQKVDALTSTTQELDKKVKSLTMLNSLSQAVASALDLHAIIESAVDAIYCGHTNTKTPVVILIADGDAQRLLIGSCRGMDREIQQAFGKWSAPDSEHAERLRNRNKISVYLGKHLFIAVPLFSRSVFLGAFAIPNEENNDALLDSMASQLAIAIDNARSYQLVADLRDNLEIKVKERTAELDVALGQLEDTVTRLEQADHAKDEFFTNVSHELKTPLTLILAPLEELEEQLRSVGREDAQGQIALVRRNGEAMLRLVNEILDFSRLDASPGQLRVEPVDLVSLVNDLIDNLQSMAHRDGISLRAELAADLESIPGDSALIRRVLINLLVNGLKYCRPGDSIAIHVVQDVQWTRIVVEDTGPGIPHDQQTRIFERFQRANDATGRLIEGSGIGLAMVKDIVERHGGSIYLESAPDQGARFTVSLARQLETASNENRGHDFSKEGSAVSYDPVALGLFKDRRVESRSPDRPSKMPRDGNRKRVLLVEDNEEMREFMAHILSACYLVSSARDGQEGFELAVSERPDVIVSDVTMPMMDGYELCRQIKAGLKTRNIPVILVTARHGPEAAVRGLEAGADDYVVKPFSPRELLARVDSQARMRSLATSLIRAEKQLAIGTLSAGIAHEVLNPANAVINAIGPLRNLIAEMSENSFSPQPEAACEELLDVVLRSGRRIEKIVRALLSFARERELRPELKESRPSDGIDSALAILGFRIEGRHAVHKDLRFDEPFLCYPDLLNQAVMNLLINALDAVPSSGGNIWISTRAEDGKLIIAVRDDGSGVPPEVAESIFDPFFTTKAPGSGTGLGLAITREIVALHGGSISLGHGDGAGAEFLLSVPISKVGFSKSPFAKAGVS